jgi:hypothetical protein
VCDFHHTFLTLLGADVSGLMLLQQSSMLNLIEATPDVIHALLRHIQAETSENPASCLANVR